MNISAQNNTETKEWWPLVLQTAFLNNPQTIRLINEYQSSIIQKKQYDYSWVPVIQTGIQDSFNLRRSDYLYILNQTSKTNSDHLVVMSPAATVSLIQKLPGNGQLSFTADYSFNYITKQNAFIQYPRMELSFSQSLSRGAFGITKDPEFLLLREQMNYSRLSLEKNLFEELKNIITLIASADIIFSQEEYYKALEKQYEIEADTAKEKNQSGLQSNLEAFYADHQYVTAHDKLNGIIFDKEEVLRALLLIIPDFDHTQINDKRNELQVLIQEIFEKTEVLSSEDIQISLEGNFDSLIFSSILEQYKLQFQNDGKQSAPILYISSSISPDTTFNSYYSDWYKSFRNLNERPYPVNFSFAVGIYKSFELPRAKSLRKEIYNLYNESIKNEMKVNQNSQKNELDILLNQIKKDTEYISTLERQLEEESAFRLDRMKLFEQERITSVDFYKSETMYYLIYADYINTFWNTIKNQLDIIEICAQNQELMNKLLGDTYENLF
ncbi:MAG: hypothetical protein IKX70_03195 [Treponema sp.]|nr:hypothetical protein [Treponema sp.]